MTVDMRYIAALARYAHALDDAPPCPECDEPMEGDGDGYICPDGCADTREDGQGLTECPECCEVAVTRTAGPLPVCLACDWTGYPDDDIREAGE